MPTTAFPQELLVSMLNELRQGMERSKKIYEELTIAVQNTRIKDALAARSLISAQNLGRLDECFNILGNKPARTDHHDDSLFLRELQQELDQIDSAETRRMVVLEKASSLGQLHEAVYVASIEAADTLGYPAISLLLESCLADRRVFAERTKRLIRESTARKDPVGSASA